MFVNVGTVVRLPQFAVGFESWFIVFGNKNLVLFSRYAVQSLQVLKRKFWKSLKKHTMQTLQIFSSRR